METFASLKAKWKAKRVAIRSRVRVFPSLVSESWVRHMAPTPQIKFCYGKRHFIKDVSDVSSLDKMQSLVEYHFDVPKFTLKSEPIGPFHMPLVIETVEEYDTFLELVHGMGVVRVVHSETGMRPQMLSAKPVRLVTDELHLVQINYLGNGFAPPQTFLLDADYVVHNLKELEDYVRRKFPDRTTKVTLMNRVHCAVYIPDNLIWRELKDANGMYAQLFVYAPQTQQLLDNYRY